MFRKNSSAIENNTTRSTDDLRREYKLIDRERAGGATDPAGRAAQNDIARELEQRGEL
ncbi:hypothetical protein SAMN05428945_2215 [Streptomyces sp. 2224.1]|uniref:hypothetical protein n=1 Tax=Streptomyces sp. 2224.1 TaxID=1881020 RepID=UPI00089BADD7|nr:hypothetical protein [Streptomyces sp. 2224.1]SEC16900.1 hypothetical protein SAMN05428945_2215 [Streptomyces sp. 2224.1]